MLEFKSLKEMAPYFNKKTNTYQIPDDIWLCFDLHVASHIQAQRIRAQENH